LTLLSFLCPKGVISSLLSPSLPFIAALTSLSGNSGTSSEMHCIIHRQTCRYHCLSHPNPPPCFHRHFRGIHS
jgi:hypothetical protein